jgi:hypothetical protein
MRLSKNQHVSTVKFCDFPIFENYNSLIYQYVILSMRKSYRSKKRILIVHEKEDLSDKPCFLVTSALHWEAKRILTSWSYRWSCEIFHEFGKQSVGFEAAQVRKEEAVKRHFRLSCVAQSFLQDIAPPVSTSEKFLFAEGRRRGNGNEWWCGRCCWGCWLLLSSRLLRVKICWRCWIC